MLNENDAKFPIYSNLNCHLIPENIDINDENIFSPNDYPRLSVKCEWRSKTSPINYHIDLIYDESLATKAFLAVTGKFGTAISALSSADKWWQQHAMKKYIKTSTESIIDKHFQGCFCNIK